MKTVRSVVAGLAGLICLYFSLININATSFTISPFHEITSFNLAFIILLFFCFGFLSGALIVWLGGHDRRKQAREADKKLQKSEKELSSYKEQTVDKDFNLLQNQG
jgi:uncharacterized integral membrane protein